MADGRVGRRLWFWVVVLGLNRSGFISGADETFVDLGVTKQVPTPWIFPAAALVAVLIVVPVYFLRRTEARAPELEVSP